MIWTTDLIDSYLNDRILLNRDIKISGLLDEGLPFVDPFHIDRIGVRSRNIIFELTEDEKNKILSLKHNPIEIEYFISGYLNNFKLRGYQKEIINTIHKNRFVILNVSRQIGMSLMALLEIMHYIISNNNKNIHVVCINSDNCKSFYNKLFLLYESLPYFIKPGVINFKDFSEIKFDNGNRIVFSTSKSIGKTIDYIILPDFAFNSINKGFKIFNDLFSIGSKDFKALIYSCPNSSIDAFSNIYNSKNVFIKKCYTWNVIDTRNDEWVRDKINLIGFEYFLKEYECMFPGTDPYKRSLKFQYLLDS